MKYLTVIFVSALLFLMTGALAVGKPVPELTPKLTKNSSFLIDGLLNERAWKSASIINSFKQINGSGKVKEQTQAYIIYGKKNLYVGFKCQFKNYSSKTKEITENGDNVFGCDAVELFIDPGRTGQYVHLAVNLAGNIYQSGLKNEIRAAVQLFKTYYQVELEIPFSAIPLASPKEMRREWGMNFCRGNPPLREWTCWSPTLAGFHNASRFGIVKGININVEKIYNKQQADQQTGDSLLSTDRTFYDKQDNINLLFKISSNLLKGSYVEISINNKTGINVYKKKFTDLYFTNKFSIPIKNLKEGKYRISAKLIQDKNSKTIMGVSRTFWKVPARKTKPFDVKIKRNAMYVDGKLFFPIVTWAWYLEWHELEKYADNKQKQVEMMEARVADLASHGFNAVISSHYFYGEYLEKHKNAYISANRGYPAQNIKNAKRFRMTMDEVLALLDKYHVKMILLPPFSVQEKPGDSHIQAWSDIVLKYREDKRVLLWMSADESDGWVKRNNQIYKMFKELDPHRPVWLNVINAVFANKNAADILATDPYPIPNTPIDIVTIHAERLKKAIKTPNKAAWLFLQMYASKRERKRCPTPIEERCMIFLSLNHGISGLAYFLYRPEAIRKTGTTLTEELWQAMKKLNLQTQEMAAPYLKGEKIEGCKATSDKLDIAARKYNGKLYVIACNTKKSKVNSSIKIPTNISLSKEGTVKFENRKITLKNNKINDSFGAYDVHVYVFDTNM